MAQNNPALFDALIAGGCGGSLERWITSANSNSYDTLVDAVEAFATAVDAAIPELPRPGPSLSQINLLQSIAQGVIAGRNLVSIDADSFADIAASIAAAFEEASPRLNNEPDIYSGGGGGGVNQISNVRWIDANTAVPVEDQDGTIGSPFSTVQAAIDALKALIPTEGEEAGTGAYFIMAFPGQYDQAEWDPEIGGSSFNIVNAAGINYIPDVSQDLQFPRFPLVTTSSGCTLTMKGIIVNDEFGGVEVGDNGTCAAEGCQIWFSMTVPLSVKLVNCNLVAVALTCAGGMIDGGRIQSGSLVLDESNTMKATNSEFFGFATINGGLPGGSTLLVDEQTDYWIGQVSPTISDITKTVMTDTP